ncbi:hypothetical protein Bhyg_17289 [Pseudolycoriella hygida]|uniref:Uncharacterized protein n=1 Tax=Pseudolycoriella hygida TaxID=35572 RepID=A0A9Q0RVZ6_9DIPT|nr:hypothetical protein Bhyg_17289 [Pseudolycoriella hygida]
MAKATKFVQIEPVTCQPSIRKLQLLCREYNLPQKHTREELYQLLQDNNIVWSYDPLDKVLNCDQPPRPVPVKQHPKASIKQLQQICRLNGLPQKHIREKLLKVLEDNDIVLSYDSRSKVLNHTKRPSAIHHQNFVEVVSLSEIKDNKRSDNDDDNSKVDKFTESDNKCIVPIEQIDSSDTGQAAITPCNSCACCQYYQHQANNIS